MAKKPGFFSRIIGFFTGQSGQEVERKRERKRQSERPLPPPKPGTFGTYVPRETREQFSVMTANQRELEIIMMTESYPRAVRQAAAERWFKETPKPLHTTFPGVGVRSFMKLARELYAEVETRP